MFSVSPSLDGLSSSLRWSLTKGAVLGAGFYLHHSALKEREQTDTAKGSPIKPLDHLQILLCHCVGCGRCCKESGKCTVEYK